MVAKLPYQLEPNVYFHSAPDVSPKILWKLTPLREKDRLGIRKCGYVALGLENRRTELASLKNFYSKTHPPPPHSYNKANNSVMCVVLPVSLHFAKRL